MRGNKLDELPSDQIESAQCVEIVRPIDIGDIWWTRRRFLNSVIAVAALFGYETTLTACATQPEGGVVPEQNGIVVGGELKSVEQDSPLVAGKVKEMLSPIDAYRRIFDREFSPENLREAVISLEWEYFEDTEIKEKFIDWITEGYMDATNSTLVTKSELLQKTKLFSSSKDFVEAVIEQDPDFPAEEYKGFANGQVVYLNLQSIRKEQQDSESVYSNFGVGPLLMQAVWHEYIHLDLKTEDVTEDIVAGSNHVGKYYYGFALFPNYSSNMVDPIEEVAVDSLAYMLIRGYLVLPNQAFAEAYYELGSEVFIELMDAIGITASELYEYHAHSQYEKLAKRVGENIRYMNMREVTNPLLKGHNILHAFNRRSVDPEDVIQNLFCNSNIRELIFSNNPQSPLTEKYGYGRYPKVEFD